MSLRLALILLVSLTLAAKAELISISTNRLTNFTLGATTEFGALSWRGGLILSSADKTFGGLSGLVLSDDCTGLLAVSDTGRWFRAKLVYENEKLAGLAQAEWAPILDSNGQPPPVKWKGDAEAIAAVGSGRYMVGFESRPRIGIYDIGKEGLAARFQLLKSPMAITKGPPNGELESVGLISAGRWKNYYLAISENNADSNSGLRAWLWHSAEIIPFTLKRLGDYAITDAATLPDGDVLILERSIGAAHLPGMAIRRFETSSITEETTVEPQLVFSGRAPFHAVDNMEGLALCHWGSETRLTIVSDNNLNMALQRTLLLQFAYRP